MPHWVGVSRRTGRTRLPHLSPAHGQPDWGSWGLGAGWVRGPRLQNSPHPGGCTELSEFCTERPGEERRRTGVRRGPGHSTDQEVGGGRARPEGGARRRRDPPRVLKSRRSSRAARPLAPGAGEDLVGRARVYTSAVAHPEAGTTSSRVPSGAPGFFWPRGPPAWGRSQRAGTRHPVPE